VTQSADGQHTLLLVMLVQCLYFEFAILAVVLTDDDDQWWPGAASNPRSASSGQGRPAVARGSQWWPGPTRGSRRWPGAAIYDLTVVSRCLCFDMPSKIIYG